MSNIAAIRRQLFGAPVRTARAAKPYDHMTKAEMWARIEEMDRRLARVRTLASDAARDAHHAGDTATRERFHAVGAPADMSVPMTEVR